MNGHRVHAFRVLVRCECGTVILWGCSYTRRRRDPKTGEQACIAIDTYQRRFKIAHRCTVARLPNRHRRTLVPSARRVFAEMLLDGGVTDSLFSDQTPRSAAHE